VGARGNRGHFVEALRFKTMLDTSKTVCYFRPSLGGWLKISDFKSESSNLKTF